MKVSDSLSRVVLNPSHHSIVRHLLQNREEQEVVVAQLLLTPPITI